MNLSNLFQPRCSHRHTILEHKNCFNPDGTPKTLEQFITKEPKILLIDIETSLMIFSSFRTGKQYLSSTNIMEDYFVMAWSAKWLGEPKVFSDVLTSKEAVNKDDKRICKSIWKLLDEADATISHNGDSFDFKKLNTRFVLHGLGLPRRYKSIDTLKLARLIFSFSSNKLDYICKFLGLEGKSDNNGYDTWLECLKGNKVELDMLSEYNKNDVVILENLYEILKVGIITPLKQPKTGWKQ